MQGRSIRRERANRRGVWVAVLVALAIVAFASWQILRIHRQNEALKLNRAALEESVSEEQAKSESLDAKSDQELTEDEIVDIAHDRFGLVFPNEIVLIPDE